MSFFIRKFSFLIYLFVLSSCVTTKVQTPRPRLRNNPEKNYDLKLKTKTPSVHIYNKRVILKDNGKLQVIPKEDDNPKEKLGYKEAILSYLTHQDKPLPEPDKIKEKKSLLEKSIDSSPTPD